MNESPNEGKDEAIRTEHEVRSGPMAAMSKESGGDLTRKHKRYHIPIAKDGFGSYVEMSPRASDVISYVERTRGRWNTRHVQDNQRSIVENFVCIQLQTVLFGSTSTKQRCECIPRKLGIKISTTYLRRLEDSSAFEHLGIDWCL